MFQQLRAEDRLIAGTSSTKTHADARLTVMEQQGMYPHEAMGRIRDQIFPPSEEDVPILGGTVQPYQD